MFVSFFLHFLIFHRAFERGGRERERPFYFALTDERLARDLPLNACVLVCNFTKSKITTKTKNLLVRHKHTHTHIPQGNFKQHIRTYTHLFINSHLCKCDYRNGRRTTRQCTNMFVIISKIANQARRRSSSRDSREQMMMAGNGNDDDDGDGDGNADDEEEADDERSNEGNYRIA